MTTDQVFFHLLLLCANLYLVISSNDFYKKFHQTDYKLKFEREQMTYVNKSYGELNYNLFKYNRTNFGSNLTLVLNIDMGYELEIIVQAYKFVSNEYRMFPMHFEYNFCKGLKHDFAGIRTNAAKCGHLSCPLKKNIKYCVCNAAPNESKLPPFMPTGQFKLELEFRYQNEIVGILESYAEIYRPILPGKRSK